MKEQLIKFYNKIKWLWFLGMAVFFWLSSVIGMLSILGLAYWQKLQPHSLDNHGIVSFKLFWFIENSWSVLLLIIIVITLLKWFFGNKKPKPVMPKGWKQPKKSLKEFFK